MMENAGAKFFVIVASKERFMRAFDNRYRFRFWGATATGCTVAIAVVATCFGPGRRGKPRKGSNLKSPSSGLGFGRDIGPSSCCEIDKWRQRYCRH